MEITYCYTVFALFVTTLKHQCNAYASGPPVTGNNLCSSMNPSHGSNPDASVSPYTIVLSIDCYEPGNPVTVIIETSAGKVVGGFLLVARDSDSSDDQTYGTFSIGTESGVKPLDCFSGTNNAIGHSELGTARARTLKWTPPENSKMNFHFRATILSSKTEYWVGVVSKTLPSCSSMTSIYEITNTTTGVPNAKTTNAGAGSDVITATTGTRSSASNLEIAILSTNIMLSIVLIMEAIL